MPSPQQARLMDGRAPHEKDTEPERPTSAVQNIDRKRLLKLLELTTSQYDAEALAAIRRANATLRRANITWEELIGPPSAASGFTYTEPPWPSEVDATAPDFFGDLNELPETGRPVDRLAAKRWLRSLPLALRVAFFPAWFTAEAYVHSVLGERFPSKLGALVVPLAMLIFSGRAWLAILDTVAGLLGLTHR
jgi:hypothetical protein